MWDVNTIEVGNIRQRSCYAYPRQYLKFFAQILNIFKGRANHVKNEPMVVNVGLT